MQKELRDIVAAAHERMRSDLIGTVFTLIQSDKELMDRYLRLVASAGNLQAVNSHLAMAVRDEFNATVAHENGRRVENKNPNSTLIKSHSAFQDQERKEPICREFAGYEKSKETLQRIAHVLSDDSQWEVKSLDNCNGLDSIVRINGQTGDIEISEIDYCRANDLILVKDNEAYNTGSWKIVEFGDCGEPAEVLCTEKTNQKWSLVKFGECRLCDVVMFKPSDSREWRSQKFGTCAINGSLLCSSRDGKSWNEQRLGDCRLDSTVLCYAAKPKVDISELIKRASSNQ